MIIHPLNDQVLVKVKRLETKTKSGIILSTDTKGEKTDLAEIIKIGSDVDIPLEIGQTIIYDKYSGMPFGDDLLFIESDNILAIVEEEETVCEEDLR